MNILTEKQIAKLKKQLIEEKEALTKNLSADEKPFDNGGIRDSVDELSTVDNHPADLATELFEREKDLSLKIHQEDELSKINAALEKSKMVHMEFVKCAKNPFHMTVWQRFHIHPSALNMPRRKKCRQIGLWKKTC